MTLKPYVGAVVHYIPMSDTELRCSTCDQPRSAIITRVHSDLDVDLLVFTSKTLNPSIARIFVPYALVTDKAPHWRWIDTGKTAVEPESALEPLALRGEYHEAAEATERQRAATDAPNWAKEESRVMHAAQSVLQPLQDAVRSLMAGRGPRDRLLLERWAQALETGSIDDTVLVRKHVSPEKLIEDSTTA